MEVDGEEEDDENDFWDEEQQDEEYERLMGAWPTQDSRGGGRRRSASPRPLPYGLRATAWLVRWHGRAPKAALGRHRAPRGYACHARCTITERLLPCSTRLDP